MAPISYKGSPKFVYAKSAFCAFVKIAGLTTIFVLWLNVKEEEYVEQWQIKEERGRLSEGYTNLR